MKKRKIYTSQDIERLSSQGFNQIQVDKYDIVTAMAQETARQLGVTLFFSSEGTPEAKIKEIPSPGEKGDSKAIEQRLFEETARKAGEALSFSSEKTPQAETKPSSPPLGKINLKEIQLRLFIDSADVEEIREAIKSGVVAGIAVNPGKVAQTKRPLSEIVSEIRQFFDGPMSVQGIAEKADDIVQEAQRLNKLSHSLVIKVPVNKEGIKAIKTLVPLGVKTNATLIFSPTQGLVAGLANSPFISPFVGRATDIAFDGIGVIRQIRSLYDKYNISTKIIAASIKNAKQVVDSIIAGADMVAVPFQVFESLFHHPLTVKGIEQFVSSGWKMQ